MMRQAARVEVAWAAHGRERAAYFDALTILQGKTGGEHAA